MNNELIIQLRSNTKNVLRSDDPEFLHDLRVAALRISFALRSFQGACDPRAKAARDKLKKAREVMGEVRNYDILLRRIGKGPGRTHALLRSRRAKAREALVKMLASSWYRQMLSDTASLMSKPPRDLHRVRIFLKELRYGCEFFSDLYGANMRKAIRRVTKFQDVLGEYHDALTCARMLSKLKSAKSGEIRRLVAAENRRATRAKKEFEQSEACR